MTLRTWHYVALGIALTVSPALGSRSHLRRASVTSHSKKHMAHAVIHVIQGQRTIDPDRTREIQAALIQRNYLAGAPSGDWNTETEAAMTKFQSDNGWQTKLTPDSRALIKLGLGPNSLPSAATNEAPLVNGTSASTDANTLATTHSILN